jgi:hypothetical protein
VLRDLWRQVAQLAVALGLVAPEPGSDDVPYDPTIYAAVYAHVLRRRHAEVLAMNAVLPAGSLSPYDFGIPVEDLRPTRRRRRGSSTRPRASGPIRRRWRWPSSAGMLRPE